MSTQLFTPRHFGFLTGVAAIHANVARATYTVPAGVRAVCTLAAIGIINDASLGAFNAQVVLRINGAIQLAIVNSVAASNIVSLASIDLVTADVIDIVTSNAVATFCEFTGTLQLREYK